ncbi:hypothetical protein FN846DRAFT_929122 [Sphaerosporella brunnea]|uniref:Frag1/DRAM/Sfk1 family-domain-containing protein n=1 Tax=Sphaerosporella brunnea TaxID=1250544 RepID=A0A5J5F9E0_9PEZI|nr:hypothetical protein FN846DRAFT_929122 [Sphaerosporella brunnea]
MFPRRKSLIIATVLVFSFLSVARAAPLDVDTVKAWAKGALPKKGTSLHDEIHCYALPYGVIGLVSHLLTYYTILCLRFQVSPLAPWKPLKHPTFDMFLAGAGLFFCVGITILTMIRCQQRWQFLVIAIWKAVLSLTLGGMNMHVSINVKSQKDREDLKILGWLFIYGMGLLTGFAGLLSLVFEAWDDHVIRLSSEIFGGIAGGVLALTFLYYCVSGGDSDAVRRSFTVIFVTFGTLPALYSDWVLAGLADNLIGVPSSDNALLYFGYFASKRIPFFSL